MPKDSACPQVATVTLNPAIDRTVSVRGLAQGEVNRARHISDRPGGKGINVAASLAEQGVATAALGFLGKENEDVFANFFAGLGIADRCQRLKGATRVGIKIVDPVRHETTDLNFPGLEPAAADMAALQGSLDALEADGVRWCVLAGSLPPGVALDFYAKTIRLLSARGIRVVLDSSGEALRLAVAAAPAVIKPNVHELSELTGRKLEDEASVIEAARELVAGGIGLVVVSRGGDGAVFVTRDQVVSARPPLIEVHSTVGAGDAMVAGIVAGHLRGLPLEQTAALATAFSLHALSRSEETGCAVAAVERFTPMVGVSVR